MSYMSASENVGFSGIPQNISETSCASQYKMAVESVPGTCNSDVNMYINDSSGDEQAYIPHLSDNFFQSKFKIDPNDLYTFHDSDVIAGEITVSNSEENVILSDSEATDKQIESPTEELDLLAHLNNGQLKDTKHLVLNGHCKPNDIKEAVDKKIGNAKARKVQTPNDNCVNQHKLTVIHPGLPSPKGSTQVLQLNSNVSNEKVQNAKTAGETFLDVFKREQILPESQVAVNKTECYNAPVKISSCKKTAAKSSKVKKGRGPVQHEALQRISLNHRVVVHPIKTWLSPDEELFECGPLDIQNTNPYKLLESSSDDDVMPDYESGSGPVCVEESAAESRSARLELRRAAMRRQVSRTATALRLTRQHHDHRALATLIKKQINGASSCRLPQQTMNHLLAMRGMTGTLSLQERRTLRASGWSGCSTRLTKESNATSVCAEEKCTLTPLPCAQYCLSHITLAPEQRLYAACAAVFAGGERCKQPLLPLQEQTPLCPEHAWKRDNYELLSRERPAKSRKRACASGRAVRAPRKRRRRLGAKRPPVHTQSLSEINAYSNSSAYDSEDTGIGGLSEGEYVGSASTELEVDQVPPDDILDPNVLNQMPDEAFTEFFNQAEGGTFAESCELAAALEAVLDERALDVSDCVFASSPLPANKMPVAVESSSAPS